MATQPALRRAMLAGYFGSAVEFYDFFIYATAAALVFPTVFFPHLGHPMATVASLGTFAAAFLARPFGAVVFGHFGDRIGRKRTLMMTLLVMGAATVGVGLLPGTATIGVLAPLILLTLRLVQGFAVGGEWAGAALLCAENSPPDRRARSCMFFQLGIGSGLVLANLVFLMTHRFFGDDSAAFLSWGWRIPFLLSAVLIVIGLYVRLRLEETEEFANTPAPVDAGLPVVELFRRQGREVLLAAGSVVCAVMLVYQASSFLSGYAATHLHYSRPVIFAVGAVGGLFMIAGIAVSGLWADGYGRRRFAVLGCAVAVPWALAILPLAQTGNSILFGLTVAVTYALAGFVITPLTAFMPSVFATRNRYTGTALAQNLGAVLGGAVPPVISPLLMTHGSWAVSLMMAGLALLSLLCVMLLREDHGAGRLVASELPG